MLEPKHASFCWSAAKRPLAALACLLALCSPGCARFSAPPVAARPETAYGGTGAQHRVLLGHSVQGQPLTLTVFGDSGPAIFILAGIHGDEPNSVDVAEGLADYLATHPQAHAARIIGILPAANPDGLAKHRRTNANGVDLNRNFPARNWRPARDSSARHGPHPESEPETRAIQRAMRLVRPVCIVSIHAISAGKYCNNYDGPARGLATLMARANGYPVEATIGHPTPGSMGSWVGIDRQIPIITLELPKGRNGRQCWEENRPALLALIRAVGAADSGTASR